MNVVSENGTSFVWANDYINLTDDGESWLLEPIIPAEGIVNFYGKPKAGKSFAAIGVAIAVSSGAPEWNGFPVKVHGPVAYLQIDTPRSEWKRRFRKIEAAGNDIRRIAIMDMKVSPYPYNILLPQHQSWFRQQLDVIKPVLVVIDTLREAHEGNENDSTDMKKVVNTIVKLARPAAILLVSHSRKDSQFNQLGAESDLMDEGRGSSYVSGRMDTVVKFTGNKGKGHMTYKGRSVEQTKVPIYQEEGTGLVFVEGTHAKQEAAVYAILKEHAHHWTRHKMAKKLVEDQVFNTTKTAERWIEKYSGLLEDSPEDTTVTK